MHSKYDLKFGVLPPPTVHPDRIFDTPTLKGWSGFEVGLGTRLSATTAVQQSHSSHLRQPAHTTSPSRAIAITHRAVTYRALRSPGKSSPKTDRPPLAASFLAMDSAAIEQGERSLEIETDSSRRAANGESRGTGSE
jgi:hypothetical protein